MSRITPHHKKLANLLDKASELSEKQLARALEMIDDLTRKKDDDEFDEWINDSIDWGNDRFWNILEEAQDGEFAIMPVLQTWLRGSCFMLGLEGKMKLEDLEFLMYDGFDMGTRERLEKNPGERQAIIDAPDEEDTDTLPCYLHEIDDPNADHYNPDTHKVCMLCGQKLYWIAVIRESFKHPNGNINIELEKFE